MDQNSTNGAGADKRNWRERLGIGAKEIPKLSDEFREPPQIDTPAAGATRPATRAPQPVTKTAPMAPRAPSRANPTAPAPASRPPHRGSDNSAQEALAEKLRAQRAAAEKLAEQRVQAARERAESRSAAPSPEPQKPAAPAKPAPQLSAPVRPSPTPTAVPTGSRPKFSFAEDEGSRREAPPVPPRPALSGSPPPRAGLGAQPPFLRPSPSAGTRPQPPYRPIDPATGYTAPPRLQTPAAGRSYGTDPSGYVPPRPPVRRPPAIDPYVRAPEPRGYAGDEYEDDARAGPRLGRPGVPVRGKARPLAPPAPPEEFDEEEVFEDEVPAPAAPRQRASARDYQNAYRENEEGFGEEQRRSSGPLLLMLALVAAALLVGGAIWYYGAKMKNVAGTGTTTSESVPVVSAPEQPAKTAPEQPADGQTGDAPAVKKKQIYDRIVGEQEVIGGQVLPTEEVPVQPATAQPAAPADATVDPAAATGQIPLPDAPALGEQTLPVPGVEEPPPLPLPPPPGGDQQGSLDQQGIGKVAATAGQPEQGSTAPPAPAAIPQPSSSDALPLPPPEIATDGAAIASADPSSSAKAAVEAAAPAAAKVISEPVVEEVAPPPAPAKKATKTATKKKPAPAPAEDLGTEPVVLVPPAEPAAPSQGGEVVASAPSVEQPAVSAPPKKKKTLLDIFRGSDDADSATTQSTSVPETQVAAVQPQAKAKSAPAPAPAPEQKTASVNGYLIQLSSFRSEPEARSEYGRLSQLYPTVVGDLPQRINQTKIGGSTRYQLALGPLNTRSDATRVCSALFSAGESDCIVRGP